MYYSRQLTKNLSFTFSQHDFSWHDPSSLFSFLLECDDEPGDPSGIDLVILGQSFSLYWPMHKPMNVLFDFKHGLKVVRW